MIGERRHFARVLTALLVGTLLLLGPGRARPAAADTYPAPPVPPVCGTITAPSDLYHCYRVSPDLGVGGGGTVAVGSTTTVTVAPGVPQCDASQGITVDCWDSIYWDPAVAGGLGTRVVDESSTLALSVNVGYSDCSLGDHVTRTSCVLQITEKSGATPEGWWIAVPVTVEILRPGGTGGTQQVEDAVTEVLVRPDAPLPNANPVADFTATRRLTDPYKFDFDASASHDSDGSIVSYSWDFGDGTTGAGVSPTHAYDPSRTGGQLVKLTVTDNGGAQAHYTKSVTLPFTKSLSASFALSKGGAALSGPLQPGDQFTVVLLVQNDGQLNANDVAPTGPLSTNGTGGVTLVSGPTPAGAATITAGGYAYFLYTYEATSGGTLTFSGQVQGTAPQPVPITGIDDTVTSPAATSDPVQIGADPVLHASYTYPDGTSYSGSSDGGGLHAPDAATIHYSGEGWSPDGGSIEVLLGGKTVATYPAGSSFEGDAKVRLPAGTDRGTACRETLLARQDGIERDLDVGGRPIVAILYADNIGVFEDGPGGSRVRDARTGGYLCEGDVFGVGSGDYSLITDSLDESRPPFDFPGMQISTLRGSTYVHVVGAFGKVLLDGGAVTVDGPTKDPALFDTAGRPGLDSTLSSSYPSGFVVTGNALYQGLGTSTMEVYNGLTFSDGDLFVDGNISVHGPLQGAGTLAASGSVLIAGSAELRAVPRTEPALVAGKAIEIGSPAPATPHQSLESVRTALQGIGPTGKAADDRHIQKAIEHLDKALDPKLWNNGSLDPKHGRKAFDEIKHAVAELSKLHHADGTAGQAITDLANADKGLAQAAVGDAQSALDAFSGGGKQFLAASKELAKARNELTKASQELADGHADKALDHYRHAWEHAQKAQEHAQRA